MVFVRLFVQIKFTISILNTILYPKILIIKENEAQPNAIIVWVTKVISFMIYSNEIRHFVRLGYSFRRRHEMPHRKKGM